MSDFEAQGFNAPNIEIPPAIAKALIAIQKKLKPLVRSAENEEYGSSYTPLDEVAIAAYKLLTKHNIGVSQPLTTIDGLAAIRTVLFCEDGTNYQDVTKLALAKVDPQSHASAITYTRRYALMAHIGLVSKNDDDDGNRASGVFLKPTDEQIEQIKSLCLAMNYTSKDIAAQVWKIKTRDHAVLTILNLNKMISQRVGDIEAADRALAIEGGQPGEHVTIVTDDDINQDPDSQSLEGRIDNLGLASKAFVNKFIFSMTSKPFLTKCNQADREILTKALNAIEAGKYQLPSEWYPGNKQPAPREPSA
jgi:hypothetical protein